MSRSLLASGELNNETPNSILYPFDSLACLKCFCFVCDIYCTKPIKGKQFIKLWWLWPILINTCGSQSVDNFRKCLLDSRVSTLVNCHMLAG